MFSPLTPILRLCKIYTVMTRAQILLPDALYNRSKRYAEFKEISMSEVFRHAVELFLGIHKECQIEDSAKEWQIPICRPTGLIRDPFADENWREKLYSREDD